MPDWQLCSQLEEYVLILIEEQGFSVIGAQLGMAEIQHEFQGLSRALTSQNYDNRRRRLTP